MAMAGGLNEPIMEGFVTPEIGEAERLCELKPIKNGKGEVLYYNRVKPWDKECWPACDDGDDEKPVREPVEPQEPEREIDEKQLDY